MVEEARMEQTEHGTAAAEDGWFAMHVSDGIWVGSEKFGAGCRLEGTTRFPQTGVHLRVLEPGVPACLYHQESAQEDFFVLEGECTLVIEEQERSLRAGHFVHCPADTNHVFVGAGDSRCVILMIGHRPESQEICYPVSAAAAKHGASVEVEANNPADAYGDMKIEPIPAIDVFD